mmetsp:Transcript_22823/g.57245  ORF Transcript_22823/g.57245 Transcript_22823/m.57245 type:complete len:258 (+) Transcript_22823:172-945(+)
MGGRKPSSKGGTLDVAQVTKAVEALAKFTGKQKDASAGLLDEEDELVYLIISLRTTPAVNRKDKPVRLDLPHSLWKDEDPEVCLIVKDRDGEGQKAAKKRLAEEKKAGVTKVIGLSKLKTKYEPHEAKRALCNQYDLFLADDRILPSLPKYLGKSFFKKKKQPIPVNLATKDWSAQVEKALGATYMFNSGGSCLNIKVARTSFATEEAVENILAVVGAAAEKVPKKWPNIQSLYLKTSESASLPIMQSLPGEPMKIQ